MTEAQTLAQPTTLIVGPVRFSYCHVFKPRANDLKQGELEYSTVVLIPKKPTEECPEAEGILRSIVAAINEAKKSKLGDIKAGWRNPLKDGDKELNADGLPRNPGYWFLNATAKSEYAPMVIDGRRNLIGSGFGSGDWGKVKLSFYGYDAKANKGVGVGLRAVQFLIKGDPLGGESSTSIDEFDIVEGAATSGQDEEYNPFADQ